jgi:hypothetical protein
MMETIVELPPDTERDIKVATHLAFFFAALGLIIIIFQIFPAMLFRSALTPGEVKISGIAVLVIVPATILLWLVNRKGRGQ